LLLNILNQFLNPWQLTQSLWFNSFVVLDQSLNNGFQQLSFSLSMFACSDRKSRHCRWLIDWLIDSIPYHSSLYFLSFVLRNSRINKSLHWSQNLNHLSIWMHFVWQIKKWLRFKWLIKTKHSLATLIIDVHKFIHSMCFRKTKKLSESVIHSLSLSHSLSHSLTHSLNLSLSHSLTLSLTHSLSHSLTLTLTLTLSLSLSLSRLIFLA
jgi:hypothetical protein